jgi:hypothetical protein
VTNKPRAIGTAAETGVVRYCKPNGFPHADRLALHGALDEGDVQLCPGVVLEVKGGKRAEAASDALVTAWLDETEVERRNRGADVAALVLKRKGKGAANAGAWWVYLPGWTFVYLAASVDYPRIDPARHARVFAALPTVRIALAALVDLLRAAGYGDPLGPSRKDTTTP